VNLGNPQECSMRELAMNVIEQCGSPSELVCMPLPQDDPRQRQPDIHLAQRVLGWSPTINLSNGLARAAADFRAHLHKPSEAIST
jgi:UDP-glucuronate decarboxylase